MCVNGCVAELERLLLTGKSQMRVTEPFRGNWARAETVDGSYKLTDWTHAIRTVQTQVKSTNGGMCRIADHRRRVKGHIRT